MKYGSFSFHIQKEQPAKYEPLGIVPYKTISIINQGEAFCRQRIAKSRKETADLEIIKTSKNDDRKIMEPMRITSGSPAEIRK